MANSMAKIITDSVPLIRYDEGDFCLRLTLSNSVPSEFDQKLIGCWKQAFSDGVMNFAAPPAHTWRKLEGRYGIYVILNPGRKNKRRAPAVFKTTKDPVDPEAFNFAKIGESQILLELAMKEDNRASLIVNLSPFAETSSMLVPRRLSVLPQILDFQGLETAVHVLLLSRHRQLRAVFNSMCAYASVNHYHFHLFYDEYPMYLESAPLEVLQLPCFTLTEYLAPAFVFCLSDDDVRRFVGSVTHLTNWLLDKDIPHSILILRGTDPGCPDLPGLILRCYVWVRIPAFGLKTGAPFYPAVLELSGRVLTFDEDTAASITEDEISRKTSEACAETHRRIAGEVRELFKSFS